MYHAKTIVAVAFAASAMLAPAAQAASWVELTNPGNSFTLGSGTFTYGPVTAGTVWVYDGANIGNQSEAAIESLLESKFSLPSTGAGSLALTDSGNLADAKSGVFTVDGSYSYLAVHYGKGELLFHFSTPVAANTEISFSGLPRGISNFRAYSAISAVPEPSTYGMLLGGIALMGLVARRRARK